MALVTPIALVIGYFAVPSRIKQTTLTLPYYLSLAPFYLWLAVMMIQPHKEERFLFPIYPLISLCGAITLDICQKIFFRVKSAILKINTATHYLNHTTFIAVFVVIMTVLLNGSRIYALYSNYHAPMDTFMEVSWNDTFETDWMNFYFLQLSTSRDILGNPNSKETINVCIGKDWYR